MDRREFTSKSKKEIKSSAESAEDTCILMNSFNSTPKLKSRRLKEEMYLRDFRTRWQSRELLLTNRTSQENQVQLDLHKEQDHLQEEVQIEQA